MSVVRGGVPAFATTVMSVLAGGWLAESLDGTAWPCLPAWGYEERERESVSEGGAVKDLCGKQEEQRAGFKQETMVRPEDAEP